MNTSVFEIAPEEVQVLKFAKELHENDQVREIFKRMGKWGLPSADDVTFLDSLLDAYRSRNSLLDSNPAGFLIAFSLLRQLETGQLSGLDDPKVHHILNKDRPRNSIKYDYMENEKGEKHVVGHSTVETTDEEVMWLASAILRQADIIAAVDRILFPDVTAENFDKLDWQREQSRVWSDFFRDEYVAKYGVANRGDILSSAIGLIMRMRRGKLATLSSPESWSALRSFPWRNSGITQKYNPN